MLTLDEIINITKERPFCLFLGAGISKEAGLPLGDEMGQMILTALGASEDYAKILNKKFHLERMMMFLKNIIGEKIYGAYSAVLDVENWGRNHKILALLSAEKNVPLLTTNQDELIEKSINSSKSLVNILKIHGTLSNQESLAITLDRVSKLSEDIYPRLLEQSANKMIIVLGYRFCDYDLIEFFKEKKDDIYFCEYNGESNDFLHNILWENDEVAYNMHVFQSSAEEFLPKLASIHKLKVNEIELIATNDMKHKERLDEWAKSIDDHLRRIAIYSLPQEIWAGRSTISAMEEIAHDNSVPAFFKLVCLAFAANSAKSTANYNKQLTLLERIRTFPEVNDNIRNFLYNKHLGDYYHIQDNHSDWEKAFALYKKAAAYMIKAESVITDTIEIGIIQNYKRSLHYAIASTLEHLTRKNRNNEYYDKSMDIVDDYLNSPVNIDVDYMCQLLMVKGALLFWRDNIKKAEQVYRQALFISEWINKPHAIDQANRVLGRILGVRRRFDEALECMEASLNHAKDTDEELLIGRNYLAQAWLFVKMGKKDEANEKKRAGQDIYMKIKGKEKGYEDSVTFFSIGL